MPFNVAPKTPRKKKLCLFVVVAAMVSGNEDEPLEELDSDEEGPVGVAYVGDVELAPRPAKYADYDAPPTLPAAARDGGICSWLTAKLRAWLP